MTLDPALLDILCCPTTRLPLEVLSGSRLEHVNRLVGERKIKRHDGTPVEQPFEQMLVTRDGKRAYPVRDGVPVLLEEECVMLEGSDV